MGWGGVGEEEEREAKDEAEKRKTQVEENKVTLVASLTGFILYELQPVRPKAHAKPTTTPRHTHTLKLFTINASATVLSTAGASNINFMAVEDPPRTLDHNRRPHHCHGLHAAATTPSQIISGQNTSSVDRVCSDNVTSRRVLEGQTPLICHCGLNEANAD